MIIIQLIYQRSLNSQKRLSIWKEAYVSAVFKREIKIKLRSFKNSEHIYEKGDWPYSSQKTALCYQCSLRGRASGISFYGLREKRSCETSLIVLLDELAKTQKDIPVTSSSLT